jgi:hypothetical protein
MTISTLTPIPEAALGYGLAEASLQARYRGAIFSHETALYLHGLTDRRPLFYSVIVPTGYNATSLKRIQVKVFFVNRGLYS